MSFEFNLMEKDTERSYLDLIEDFDEQVWTGEDFGEIFIKEK